jgi:hypothetical protein
VPYQPVKAWWNALTPEQRLEEALNLLGEPDVFRSWTEEWDRLSPYSQHTKLYAYYRGLVPDGNGAVMSPIHKPDPGDSH